MDISVFIIWAVIAGIVIGMVLMGGIVDRETHIDMDDKSDLDFARWVRRQDRQIDFRVGVGEAEDV